MTEGVRRRLLLAGGWLALALAAVGAVVPLLPTVPFVLLAAGCFARSSPVLHARLLASPLFGPVIRDWEQKRGVRPRTKIVAVSMIVLSIGLTIAFGRVGGWLKALLVLLGIVGLTCVLRLRTVR